MQKTSHSKSSRTRWAVAGVLFTALLAVPLFALVLPAEAEPPAHAPAWGYRAKQDNGVRIRRHRSSHSWDDDEGTRKHTYRRSHTRRSRTLRRRRTTNHIRRYRTFYRTRRDENGRRYRQYYRVYDR